MKTTSEYRLEARMALQGHWGIAIGVSIVYGLLLGAISWTGIGTIILGGAFLLGYAMFILSIVRLENPGFEKLFAGFSTGNFTSTIGLFVRTTIYVTLWSFLFIIPGIVKGYSYSMAPYILADNPELTGKEAITASRTLMDGKKMKLFCLDFSFIGWILLSILTCGLLFIWLMPYMETSRAAFYESIKDEIQVLHVNADETVEVEDGTAFTVE